MSNPYEPNPSQQPNSQSNYPQDPQVLPQQRRDDTPQAQQGGPQKPKNSGDRLREIAKFQRLIIILLAIHIVLNIALIPARIMQDFPVPLLLGAGIIGLTILILTISSVFTLASLLHNPGLGFLCALLVCIPCVQLIILVILNQQATSTLQQAGIRVGFFGVNPDTI